MTWSPLAAIWIMNLILFRGIIEEILIVFNVK
jgi:hypothetical protein